jgi:calcineurin-like phosphoesterase family protein
VKPGDRVYHLGDVFMGPKEEFVKKWKRLNGRKNLILGNHDDAKFFAQRELVNKIQMWRMFPEFGVLLSHVPIHTSSLMRYPNKDGTNGVTEPVPLLNIHGHIHQNPSPDGPYKCVCVEHIDYTPIHIEDVLIKL